MATEHPTTSRRRLLAACTAAALTAPVAPVPALAAVSADPHPDAALLDLCRRWHVDWNAVTDLGDVADNDDVNDRMDVVNDLEHVIAGTPALTLTGLAAKVEVLKVSDADNDINLGEGLLASILEDIAALAGEADHA